MPPFVAWRNWRQPKASAGAQLSETVVEVPDKQPNRVGAIVTPAALSSSLVFPGRG